jgi:hypothetical protein
MDGFAEDILIYDKNVDAANNIDKDALNLFYLDHNSANVPVIWNLFSLLAICDLCDDEPPHEQPDDFATYTYSDTGMKLYVSDGVSFP